MEPNPIDGNPWVAISTESALKVLTEISKRLIHSLVKHSPLVQGIFFLMLLAEYLSFQFPLYLLSFLQLPSSGIFLTALLNGITVPSFQNWEKEKDLEMW